MAQKKQRKKIRQIETYEQLRDDMISTYGDEMWAIMDAYIHAEEVQLPVSKKKINSFNSFLSSILEEDV